MRKYRLNLTKSDSNWLEWPWRFHPEGGKTPPNLGPICRKLDLKRQEQTLELRSHGAATEHKNHWIPEIWKNTKTPGWAPKMGEQKKERKDENSHKTWPFSYFLCVVVSYFQGPTWGGGLYSVCDPLCCKSMWCASRFGRVAGKLWARRAINAGPGARSEAPGWSSGGGAWSAPMTGKPRQSAHDWLTQAVFQRGLWEKRSFQKSPFSRDSREFRDSRDSRESHIEKTPFVMTPFSGPESQGVFSLIYFQYHVSGIQGFGTSPAGSKP